MQIFRKFHPNPFFSSSNPLLNKFMIRTWSICWSRDPKYSSNMACTYFRVLFLACDGRRRGDPNDLWRWKLFFPPWKLVYAYWRPFLEEHKLKGNYSSLYSFSTERFGHDMKLGDTIKKCTKIFLLRSFRFIADKLFTLNRFFAMSINEIHSK